MRFKLLNMVIIFASLLLSITCHAKQDIEFNTQEFPPYSFTEKGQLAGAISEIVVQACEQINVKCAFNLHKYWGTAIKTVKKGDSDALFVVGKNTSREDWLHFSLPILPAEYGFFALKEGLKYQSLSDLAGLKVGVYGPSNTAFQLALVNEAMEKENLTPMNIMWAFSTTDAIEDMLRGKLDVIYSNKAVGEAYNLLLPEQFRMRYLGKHKDLLYYVAFSKKTVSADFVERFNRALLKMERRGELKRLLEKYNLPYVAFADDVLQGQH